MTVDDLEDIAYAFKEEGYRLNEDPASVMAVAHFDHEGFSDGSISVEVSGEEIVWLVLWNGDTELFSDDLNSFEEEKSELGLPDLDIWKLDWHVCFPKELLEGLDSPGVPKTEAIKLAITLLKKDLDSYDQERES